MKTQKSNSVSSGFISQNRLAVDLDACFRPMLKDLHLTRIDENSISDRESWGHE